MHPYVHMKKVSETFLKKRVELTNCSIQDNFLHWVFIHPVALYASGGWITVAPGGVGWAVPFHIVPDNPLGLKMKIGISIDINTVIDALEPLLVDPHHPHRQHQLKFCEDNNLIRPIAWHGLRG